MSRHLTRREAIRAAGGVWAASLALPAAAELLLAPAGAFAATRCARLTPELTEGPFWVPAMPRRSDVRASTSAPTSSRQAGVPLELSINVVDASERCAPLNGVAVDIWHANAHGLYSDEAGQSAGGGTSATAGNTSGENWLRGYQISGHDRGLAPQPVAGQVSFRTIWPGWYSGRAIHIHVRVRRLSSAGATIAGYTTQIFFSDADNDRVLGGAAPYNARGPRNDPTTDENDSVLRAADRSTNIVPVAGSIANGFRTTFNIALDDVEVGARGSLARPNG